MVAFSQASFAAFAWLLFFKPLSIIFSLGVVLHPAPASMPDELLTAFS